MPLKVILFLFIFICCAIGALFQPILGVCGYIFTYCVYSEHVWWGKILAQYSIRYSYVMALFLAIGLLLQRDKLKWNIAPYNKLEILFYLFPLIVGLSLFLGIEPDENSYYLFNKMLKVSIFIFMLTRVVTSFKDYNAVIYVFIITGIYLGFQAFTAPRSMFFKGRLNALGGPDFTGSNELAIHLGAILCFLGVAILRTKKWLIKTFYIIGAAFVLNAIILTRTRAIFIALLAAAIYAFLFAPKEWRRQILIYVSLGVLLFYLLADPLFWQRMKTIEKPEEEASATHRLWIWRASTKMLKDHPFGIGAGNFSKMIGYYDERVIGRDAHNTFVRCYGELGIQGLLLFSIILFSTFKQLRRVENLARGSPLEQRVKIEVFTLSLVLVVYIVAGLTHTRLYTEELWWFLALPICLEKAVLNYKITNNRR